MRNIYSDLCPLHIKRLPTDHYSFCGDIHLISLCYQWMLYWAWTPSILWATKVGALMIDTETKILGIEDTVPNALGSSHHRLHLLCKSFNVDAFDKSKLQVLSSIEKATNQQQIFENINPVLWSFFRGKIALVETGIGALLDLITHNKSARLCSQADLFDHICEREGQNKILFLYQQHRFTKCSSFYSWS